MDERIKKEKNKFVRYLEDSNLRMTKGREEVFEEIMQTHGHFAAEELVRYCAKHHRKVSRATIYRSLKELREAGVIRETAFGEKHIHYEHVYDEKLHHHARCIRCGEFIELNDLGEEHRYISQLKSHGFKIIGHELHFYGFCKKCQE
ncbi:MAG: transcriptional repressor [Candidatus Omnitrophica bacterium]|nr:transcriptional repressor [Candidatus Omnitrophota bacterium]